MDIPHIKLAVRRHIANAKKALRRTKLDDEAVHAARKALKRARSGLRLLRPLDEAAYRRENTRLRNAGRRLSGVRDDKVLLARLADLIEGEKQPARRRLLLRLRQALRNARRRDWRALRAAAQRHRIEDTLGEAAKRVRIWRVPQDAAAAPELALRKLYRKGRKALKRSRKEPSDERLHEARKQAKRLAQALEILAGKAPPKKAKKVLERAGDVGDYLGDDHDLAVVESRFMHLPAAPDKAKLKLRTRVEKRRARLQKKALKAGRKLFRKKTRRVLSRASRSSRSPRAGAAPPPAVPAAGPA
jgi:CHAD domain-containing protein